jgi:uncharacterized membrane protein
MEIATWLLGVVFLCVIPLWISGLTYVLVDETLSKRIPNYTTVGSVYPKIFLHLMSYAMLVDIHNGDDSNFGILLYLVPLLLSFTILNKVTTAPLKEIKRKFDVVLAGITVIALHATYYFFVNRIWS